jgi:hypothetical protein
MKRAIRLVTVTGLEPALYPRDPHAHRAAEALKTSRMAPPAFRKPRALTR